MPERAGRFRTGVTLSTAPRENLWGNCERSSGCYAGGTVSTPERDPAVPREELDVLLEARRELSTDHDSELIEGFLDRVGGAIDARVEQELAKRGEDNEGDDEAAIGLALGSLGIGIPLTAAAGATVGLPGMIVAWIGIVAVNVAYALRRR
jgi:hypothetical protein